MALRNFIYIFSDTVVPKLLLLQDQSPGFFYQEIFNYSSGHL